MAQPQTPGGVLPAANGVAGPSGTSVNAQARPGDPGSEHVSPPQNGLPAQHTTSGQPMSTARLPSPLQVNGAPLVLDVMLMHLYCSKRL